MTELVSIPSEGWEMHGIVHVPTSVAGQSVGVVLFQGNLNPKFGAHRLFRQIADSLAGAGFYALRYDNRGTCDSPGICKLEFEQRVADGRAAVSFFRNRYALDVVVAWGLCMGAAAALHCAARPRHQEEMLNGLILCNILADPALASMPEFGYRMVDAGALLRKAASNGGLLRKLVYAPRKLHIYRQNLPKLFRDITRRYLRPEPALDSLQAEIKRVGRLLAGYPGPILLIFGEKDFYWTNFQRRVNPADRLGLARKKFPAQLQIIPEGDHTFASREQTQEMIRCTTAWLEPFQRGLLPDTFHSYRGNENVVSVAPVADPEL